ncbi:hypothetical protein JCM30471_32340 [Desulfuromonas carbonis]|uniref:Lcl C-terminal domain-containing protein n=1 Tax=Desulfuromonas sp. DDH964 TaxID=1823759 RepID=UPI00078EE361|nr:DUF1566 domain-containing protein [Desulfuromonas sp. DDH964]AMV71395.1 hypothetical protein DBW_1013 [Desulfuromonas sp. DDH964]
MFQIINLRYLALLGSLLLLLATAGHAADFVARADGTVRDRQSGLVWQAMDDGTPRSWSNAEIYCQELNLGGLQGWRLPHRPELQSLLRKDGAAPLIDETLFPLTKALKYWTAERDTKFDTFAWTVGFGSGLAGLDDVGRMNFVRCVH